jgi:hypothetical protein
MMIDDDESEAMAATVPGAFGGGHSQHHRAGASIPVPNKMPPAHALSPGGSGE